MKNRKRNKYVLLLVLLLAISVGYALLSTTLKINGTSIISKNTWSIYWANPVVTEGSVTTTLPTIGNDTNGAVDTVATWSTTLSLPGDYYEFTLDAVNNGTIDAMITDIEDTVTPELPSYIKYEVTYEDGTEIGRNHLLAKKNGNTPTTEKYKVRVEFLNTITPEQMEAIPENGVTYTFNYAVTYSQATSAAISKPRISAWVLPEGKTANTLTSGDEICLKDDLTQCFDFIRYDGDDVVMITKYNLKVGSNYNSRNLQKIKEYTIEDEGYGKQSSETIGCGDDLPSYNGTLTFSSMTYWDDNGTPKSEYPGEYWPGPNFPTIYDPVNYAGAPGEDNYSIAYYVELYKTILTNEYNVELKDIHLLTYIEAIDESIGCDPDSWNCPENSFIKRTSFWLGSGDSSYVWYIDTHGYIDEYEINSKNLFGVRPVVVITKADL